MLNPLKWKYEIVKLLVSTIAGAGLGIAIGYQSGWLGALIWALIGAVVVPWSIRGLRLRARFDQYEFPSFRSILETLGLICGFLLPFALAAYFGSIGKGAYAPFIIFLGWAGTFYLAYKKDKKDRAEWQMRRDQAAITLFNAVRSGDQKEFAVFLRPFYTTDQIETVEESRVSQGSGKSETEFIHHPLEDTIVEAFRYTMPVVGLGKPGETFGVGRIFVDEGSWQSAAS